MGQDLIFQKELTFKKQIHQNNIYFIVSGNLNHVFVINVALDVSFPNQKELKY